MQNDGRDPIAAPSCSFHCMFFRSHSYPAIRRLSVRFHGRTICAVLAGLLCLAFTGCAPKATTATGAKGYFGPTLVMAAVVEQINKNNQAIPTIWAQHYYEADIVDPKTSKKTFVNGNGVLLYRRPSGFTLTGRKDVYGEVFEIGNDDERYWMKLTPPGDTSRMWFGEHRHLGKPCVQALPIQPNLLMEVLGVGVIDTNFVQPPAPVMRFNPDADCYMFVWVAPDGGPGRSGPARLVAQREIWYDRTTFLPRKIMLFDANGRVLLHALLDGHKAIEENGPKVATSYRMFFPDNGSKMTITIDDLRFSKGQIPARRGIVFPGATAEEAGVNEVIKLDKDCID
jgi:hypothetical protein